MMARRTFAGAAFCASAGAVITSASTSAAIGFCTVPPPRFSKSYPALLPAARFDVPADEARLAEQEQPIQHVAEHGESEDAGVHVRDLEGALREQREIAQSIVRHDHLAE